MNHIVDISYKEEAHFAHLLKLIHNRSASLMNQPHLWCPKVRLIHETRILGGGAASLQQRVKGQCATFEKANGYSGSKDERRRYGAAVA